MVETFRSGDKDIRMDIYSGLTQQKPQPAIVLLHGSGGNIGFWLERLAPYITSAGVTLFAPHYFERTGTVRADLATITDGIHAPQWIDTISSALSVIASRSEIDPQRIALLGISLGAFLSTALAATNSASSDPATRNIIRCIVEVYGGIAEPYASQATPAFPPTLILHGNMDEIVPMSQAHDLDALLIRLGVEHEVRILQGEGHWFSGAAQMQMLLSMSSFLSKHLRRSAYRYADAANETITVCRSRPLS